MTSILTELETRVRGALARCLGDEFSCADPQVRLSQDERFGDYQSNCAMGLAKRAGEKPRDVATRIVETLDVADLCEPPEIAGPGFINFRLKPSAVAARLQAVPPAPRDGRDRLGIETADEPTTVVIDMGSPNLAKEMHVGHLRSTIIGDAIARILEFEGHTVHRINHVGDWGTQFGMLVAYLRESKPDALRRLDQLELPDLEAFYVAAKDKFDRDEIFAAEARRTVTLLQGGDPETRVIWKAFCDESLRHCHDIFDRLDIRVEDRGESFYNDMLAPVVEEFESKGLTTISDGALCVFLDGFVNREGNPLPMMIRKSDGGYNYSATDLAAIKHRLTALGARRLLYVVGAPQKQHLAMLFAAARKIIWLTDEIQAEHIAFGSVLGADGRPFKTREGGTVKLKALLDEAVARARKVVESTDAVVPPLHQVERRLGGEVASPPTAPPPTPSPRAGRGQEKEGHPAPLTTHYSPLTDEERSLIAETVGLAAVKYFDLSHNLTSDYKFDFDTMLAMEGNTAPYMLYAFARIRSIGRKAGIDYADIPADAAIVLEHESEIRLGKALARFPEVLATAARELRPNILTDYLFELSKAFSGFYDRVRGVRVIDASPEPVRLSRLRLCDVTARTIRLGLHLLGIKTLERM